MIIHREQLPITFQDGRRGYKLVASYINKEGNVGFLQYDIPQEEMFEWKYTTHANADPEFYEWDYQNNCQKLDANGQPIVKRWMSYDNKYVARVPTNNPLSSNRIVELMQHLEKQYPQQIGSVFEMNNPNAWYCDIEVEVSPDGFPDAEVAATPVNTISLTKFPQTIIWSRKPLTEDEQKWVQQQIDEYSEKNCSMPSMKDITKGYKFEFRCFDNEHDMLEDFIKFIIPIPALLGWNFLGFDWVYIWNRCEKNGIDTTCLNPTRTTTIFKLTPRSGGATIKVNLPMHKIISDYLLIIKTWEMSLGNLPDYKLDTVAEKCCSIKKVNHPWGFDEFYRDHFKEYVFYNCIDTILIEQIDKVIHTANVWYMLTSILRTELNDCFSTIKPCETVMQVFEYDHYKVFPNVRKKVPDTQEAYEGAWVIPVHPGIYRHVGGLDFASLYPSIMREWNISPENFRYKKDPDYKPKKDEIKTVSGAIYGRNEEAMIPAILTYYYNLRKSAKNDMKDCDEEVEFLEEILKRREAEAKKSV